MAELHGPGFLFYPYRRVRFAGSRRHLAADDGSCLIGCMYFLEELEFECNMFLI